nr:hypothetical protein [Tanacetum cinerariifolium]
MGGSSSQPRTKPAMSPINAFSVEELYTPEFSNSLQENTGYWQQPNPHEYPVEQVATSPKKKATTGQGQSESRWEKKIKGQNLRDHQTKHGNSRKQGGFWCEVLSYMESKTQQYSRRMYNMVLGKWKTVRPSVVRFCGIYNNIMRMGSESGVKDPYYVQMAMIYYEIDTRLPFKLCHCWEILKDNPKWQETTIPNFNTGSERGNSTTRGQSKSSASSSVNEDALDRLMVTEMGA